MSQWDEDMAEEAHIRNKIWSIMTKYFHNKLRYKSG